MAVVHDPQGMPFAVWQPSALLRSDPRLLSKSDPGDAAGKSNGPARRWEIQLTCGYGR